MTVTSLVADLSQRGVQLAADGDQLVIDHPDGELTDADFEVLRQHKQELLRLLNQAAGAAAAPLLEMSLDDYARQGAPMEIRTRWLPVTIWFSPDERHARALVAEGVSRGRIWTAAELRQLMSLDEPKRAAVTLANAKSQMDGDITEVRSSKPGTVAGNGGIDVLEL